MGLAALYLPGEDILGEVDPHLYKTIADCSI